jgi:hypothetical protein
MEVVRGRPGRRSAADREEAVLELMSGKASVKGRLNVHCRCPTCGNTDARWAPVSMALRVVHDGNLGLCMKTPPAATPCSPRTPPPSHTARRRTPGTAAPRASPVSAPTTTPLASLVERPRAALTAPAPAATPPRHPLHPLTRRDQHQHHHASSRPTTCTTASPRSGTPTGRSCSTRARSQPRAHHRGLQGTFVPAQATNLRLLVGLTVGFVRGGQGRRHHRRHRPTRPSCARGASHPGRRP